MFPVKLHGVVIQSYELTLVVIYRGMKLDWKSEDTAYRLTLSRMNFVALEKSPQYYNFHHT